MDFSLKTEIEILGFSFEVGFGPGPDLSGVAEVWR
jgi:hypothetical protein